MRMAAPGLDTDPRETHVAIPARRGSLAPKR
jgi:hypothetical protein